MFNLKTHVVNGGTVHKNGAIYRLGIPPASAQAYTDAQLDDYDETQRDFAHVPPTTLKLRARFSSNTLKGTAGFGFWNAPFGPCGQVLAAPSNVWFFNASAESNLQTKRGFRRHGFAATALNSPQVVGQGGWLGWMSRVANLALRIPVLSRLAMFAAQSVVRAHETQLSLNMTDWHTYEIRWQKSAAVFLVDEREMLRATNPPQHRLGFVAWIDNYKATAANGIYQFGYVACAHEQWLEIEMD